MTDINYENKTKQITVRMHEDIYRRFKLAAHYEFKSMSDIAYEHIIKYVEKKDKEKKKAG